MRCLVIVRNMAFAAIIIGAMLFLIAVHLSCVFYWHCRESIALAGLGNDAASALLRLSRLRRQLDTEQGQFDWHYRCEVERGIEEARKEARRKKADGGYAINRFRLWMMGA